MPLGRFNPIALLLILIVRVYQVLVSPLLPASCRYVPSCSQYMIDAIRGRGVIVGVVKGLYRILRCNPFCRGGYDPAD